MKILFHQNYDARNDITEEYTKLNLRESIEKTRQALEIAYSGFDNALEIDLIDSYIYEINSLQKRYKHLVDLAAEQPEAEQKNSCPHSSIRSLVSSFQSLSHV